MLLCKWLVLKKAVKQNCLKNKFLINSSFYILLNVKLYSSDIYAAVIFKISNIVVCGAASQLKYNYKFLFISFEITVKM